MVPITVVFKGFINIDLFSQHLIMCYVVGAVLPPFYRSRTEAQKHERYMEFIRIMLYFDLFNYYFIQ